METTNGVIARSLVLNVLVHAAAVGIGLGIFEFLNPDLTVSPRYIAALGQTAADMSALYTQAGEDTISLLRNWWLISIAVGFVASTIWLIIADLRRPTSPAQARSAFNLWLGLLLFAALLLAGLGFFYFELRKDLQLQLLGVLFLNAQKVRPQLLAEIVAGSAVTTILGYYLGTAIGVKRAMRASVPFASFFIR